MCRILPALAGNSLSAQKTLSAASAVCCRWSDADGPKLIAELDRAGLCFPPTYCKAPAAAKAGKQRSYLHVYEGSIEENMYAPKVCCGCCACPCGKGQDNVFKQYFDHSPFYPSPNQSFATDADLNFCCFIPFIYDGFDCSPLYSLITKPCVGGTISIVKAKPPCCSCVDDDMWFKMATRDPAPLPCLCCFGPKCCTRPLMLFLKNSIEAQKAMSEALPPALMRKKAPTTEYMQRDNAACQQRVHDSVWGADIKKM